MEAEGHAELEAQWQSEGVDNETIGRRLAEIAKREAEQAEAAEDEQPDPAPSPADEPSETDLVREANGAYIAQIAQIFGGLDGIKPCPYCAGLGFDALELPQDPTTHTCERCHGYGNVVTGSKVPSNETRICTLCNGSGFQADEPAVTPPPVPTLPAWTPPAAPAQPPVAAGFPG